MSSFLFPRQISIPHCHVCITRLSHPIGHFFFSLFFSLLLHTHTHTPSHIHHPKQLTSTTTTTTTHTPPPLQDNSNNNLQQTTAICAQYYTPLHPNPLCIDQQHTFSLISTICSHAHFLVHRSCMGSCASIPSTPRLPLRSCSLLCTICAFYFIFD